MDGTVIPGEELTFTIRFFEEGKAFPIRSQAGVALDELRVSQAQKRGDPCDFSFGQADLAGPAATGGTTLAFVENRHDS